MHMGFDDPDDEEDMRCVCESVCVCEVSWAAGVGETFDETETQGTQTQTSAGGAGCVSLLESEWLTRHTRLTRRREREREEGIHVRRKREDGRITERKQERGSLLA